ncbi:MAG TPA: GIY-YIG nuclease family protein [Caulobacteraceae bacterium]|nr:GIY-YIG nuclease family protein [Caulobacteraceae bacterium]
MIVAWGACPCKGWPSATAYGGFDLDKAMPPSFVAHHEVNGQEWIKPRHPPTRFSKEADMIIKAFGLFWREDEIEWEPGSGKKGVFRLLGRCGENSPGIRVADFRTQRGIYILYNEYGAYYVGLTRKQTLGKRIADHRYDGHGDKWDRFSWFGFHQVLKSVDSNGYHHLKAMPEKQVVSPSFVIADIEALLIKAMGLRNIAQMKFANADEWTQIKLDEIEKYRKKVSRRND